MKKMTAAQKKCRNEDRIRLFGIIVKQMYGILCGVTPYPLVNDSWDSCNICGFTGMSKAQVRGLRTLALAKHAHDGKSHYFYSTRYGGTLFPTLCSLERLGFVKIDFHDTLGKKTLLTILWTPEQFKKVVG